LIKKQYRNSQHYFSKSIENLIEAKIMLVFEPDEDGPVRVEITRLQ